MSSDPSRDSPEPAGDGGSHRGGSAQNDAWGAFGLMLSGVIVWGGVGYLLSQWLHSQLFVLVGLLVGMGTALYGVWFRYGRS